MTEQDKPTVRAERKREDGQTERLVFTPQATFGQVDPKLLKDWPEVFNRRHG